MAVPLALRPALSDLLTVAAELARTGDDGNIARAREVKDARDAIARATCDHREGYASHLTMGGTVSTCRACGAPEEDR